MTEFDITDTDGEEGHDYSVGDTVRFRSVMMGTRTGTIAKFKTERGTQKVVIKLGLPFRMSIDPEKIIEVVDQ